MIYSNTQNQNIKNEQLKLEITTILDKIFHSNYIKLELIIIFILVLLVLITICLCLKMSKNISKENMTNLNRVNLATLSGYIQERRKYPHYSTLVSYSRGIESENLKPSSISNLYSTYNINNDLVLGRLDLKTDDKDNYEYPPKYEDCLYQEPQIIKIKSSNNKYNF